MSSNPYNNAFGSIYSQESGNMNESTAHNNNIDDQDQLTIQNQDTFLSRIFGLNSIYNQLQDNYQYYDPEYDNAFQQQQRRSLLAEDVQQNISSEIGGGNGLGLILQLEAKTMLKSCYYQTPYP